MEHITELRAHISERLTAIKERDSERALISKETSEAKMVRG
jgi:chorismate mutase